MSALLHPDAHGHISNLSVYQEQLAAFEAQNIDVRDRLDQLEWCDSCCGPDGEPGAPSTIVNIISRTLPYSGYRYEIIQLSCGHDFEIGSDC